MTGADRLSFEAICERGSEHESQRTRQATTGACAQQEANRDNEAKSAQAKGRQAIHSHIPGGGAGRPKRTLKADRRSCYKIKAGLLSSHPHQGTGAATIIRCEDLAV